MSFPIESVVGEGKDTEMSEAQKIITDEDNKK
jgi:hypothetical protein